MNRKGVNLHGRFHNRDTTLFIERKCLKCGMLFKSDGIGNRVCAPCRLTNQKIY